MNRAKTIRKIGRKIPKDLEKRVVELSFQNPELGAKGLLPLLNLEEIKISSSSVYRILSRHGMQNRVLRLAKIEEQRLAEAPSQADAKPSNQRVVEPLPVKQPAPVAENIEKRAPSSRPLQAMRATEKPSRWDRSFFFIVNFLLLALIGFLGFHAVKNFQQARMISDAVTSIESSPIIAAVQPQSTPPRPLSYYRGIWHRNLFNVQKEMAPMIIKDETLNDIVVVKANLGLKLLGTVVTNNNPMSLAIIQNQKTAKQGIYYEEDKVGKAYVKKILRNKVIISIDNGHQLLTVEPEDFGKARASAPRQLEDHEDFEVQREEEEEDFEVQGDPEENDSFDSRTPERTITRSRPTSRRRSARPDDYDGRD